MIGFLRAAYVIGRRDFVATVWSRTFLFFLLGPLIILAISVLFGNVSQQAVRQDTRVAVAVITDVAEFEKIARARERLNPAFQDRRLPDLVWAEPAGDSESQIQSLLGSSRKRVLAVLSGGVDRPKLTGAITEQGIVSSQVELILDKARQNHALGRAEEVPELEVVRVASSAGSVATVRAVTARAGQLILFMLTVLLAGMLLSNMLEEKSNKVIEVLAAAVPVDAIFLGKIFSMLAVSLVGILVWGTSALAAATLWKGGMVPLPEPAVGWPLFILMVIVYYSVNYLLLGALLLAIGSQASTVREVQTLSMPVTVGQMLILAFAFFAVGPYNSPIGIAAAAFPFSSPLAMVARAAQTPELWPHLLALVWQTLWVWLTVRMGASLFRRNVLKSGSPKARLKRA
jgi:ABC-2 type transport system permease protein